MKSFLFLCCITLFCSCIKKHECTPSSANPLIGKWTWVKTYGGIGGIEETPENSGKIITLEFLSNGEYIYTLNKVSPKRGIFLYRTDGFNHLQTIQFDQDPEQTIAELNEIYLEYGDAPVDGLNMRYVKTY